MSYTNSVSRASMVLVIFIVLFGGCSKDHLDPTQIGRFRPVPVVNVILDSLGVAEEASPLYAGAEEPRPADVISHERDYVFGRGDLLRVVIYELLQENRPYVNDFQITESGNISIPDIGHVQVVGLTEMELEDEIAEILMPTILKNPAVTISLQRSQSRVFSILGDGIAKPSRYGIPRYDFRLMDALAMAGSARQFNVSYIYIIRQITGEEDVATAPSSGYVDPVKKQFDTRIELKPIEPRPWSTDPEKLEDDVLEILAPYAKNKDEQSLVVMTSSGMMDAYELESLAMPEGLVTVETVPEATGVAAPEETLLERSETAVVPRAEETKIEWIFENGKWIPVSTGETETVSRWPEYEREKLVEPTREQVPHDYGWEQIVTAGIQTRVIEIPADKLFSSDPRYNIIIKPGDTISVRLDVIGEFYVGGNVNRVGVFNLTGRQMTLKQAIIVAGGLGPLAWPKKCEIVRRIEEKKEEIVMVNLEKIANGSQPDFFIKHNDQINVGLHGTSRWLAVLRNAFRATYGFGFIYDRNFQDKQFETLAGDIFGIKAWAE